MIQTCSSALQRAALLPLTWLLLVCFAVSAQAQTDHYSALVQANQPQFAARLQTPGKPDQGSLLGRTPASSMEYRIVADRMNNRRFFKLLADAIAVNSDSKTLAKNAGYISRSRTALPTEMQPNDALVFTFDGKSTVQMRLNGTQVASYEAPDFYRMLLSTWVGEVPISSRFKREILGLDATPSDVRALFDTAEPSATRRAQVADFAMAAAANIAAASAQQSAAIVVAKATPAAATKTQPAAVVPKVVAKLEVKAAPKAEPKVEPTAKPTAKPTPKPQRATASTKPAAAPSSQQAISARQKNAPVVAVAPKAIEPEPAPVLTEEEEARKLLVRQEYLKNLNHDINTQKHIPPQAFTRRAEGSVRLAISLDQNGKLLKVEVVEPSRYSMFNEQALEAVSNAQPFTPPPGELDADPFEFETTLYYDLPL